MPIKIHSLPTYMHWHTRELHVQRPWRSCLGWAWEVGVNTSHGFISMWLHIHTLKSMLALVGPALILGHGYSITSVSTSKQAEPWWRASIWRSHRKVVIKQCSYHNNIIDIQNRLPYSKVVYPAIIVLFSCLMEVNHGVRTGPDYPFR